MSGSTHPREDFGKLCYSFPQWVGSVYSYRFVMSKDRALAGDFEIRRKGSLWEGKGRVFGKEIKASLDQSGGEITWADRRYRVRLASRKLTISDGAATAEFSHPRFYEAGEVALEGSTFPLPLHLDLGFAVFLNALLRIFSLGFLGRSDNRNFAIPSGIAEEHWPMVFLGSLLFRTVVTNLDFD